MGTFSGGVVALLLNHRLISLIPPGYQTCIQRNFKSRRLALPSTSMTQATTMPDIRDSSVHRILTAGGPRAVHLVGVCGSGMKALAEVFLGRGWRVSGTDLQAGSPAGHSLRHRGVTLFAEHSANHIPAEVQLVVYSSAVKPDNPERQWAVNQRVASCAYHEMLGEMMDWAIGISIAGTHGKSTTTALTGSVLTTSGMEPTVLVGAEVCGPQANGWTGTGPHLVVESCEYRRHFLSLHPQMAAILGIEADHFDCFADVAETVQAFHEFALQLPAEGLLVIHQECESTRLACRDVAARIETFSFAGGADWQAVEVEKIPLGHRFQILHRGQEFCRTQLRIPGRHHVLNALAAVALCHRAGATAAQIAAGIDQFHGIRRRFEVLGDVDGVTVIDDYAHHPTAIRATLQTAREEFGDRRLVCVFQPHQVSRTVGLLGDFATSFSLADEVVIVPVYGAREVYQKELLEVSARLAELITQQGVAARYSGSLDQTRASLDDTLRPRDVLLTLGAGDIDRIHHDLTRRLQRNHTP